MQDCSNPSALAIELLQSCTNPPTLPLNHMSIMACQITVKWTVCSTVCLGQHQIKHESPCFGSFARRGIHRWMLDVQRFIMLHGQCFFLTVLLILWRNLVLVCYDHAFEYLEGNSSICLIGALVTINMLLSFRHISGLTIHISWGVFPIWSTG